jgi:hypothetical protein
MSGAAAAVADDEAVAVMRRLSAALSSKAYDIASPAELIGVSLWGSRLWGTATKTSDYDLVVIHRSAAHPDRRFGATICPGIDTKVESAQTFAEQVCSENDVAAWLTLLLPLEAWIYRAPLFDAFCASVLKAAGGRPNLERMRSKLHETILHDRARAIKQVGPDGDGGVEGARKARKIAVHSLRLVAGAILVWRACGVTGAAAPATAAAAPPAFAKRQPQSVVVALTMSDLCAVQVDVVDAFFDSLAERGINCGDMEAVFDEITARLPQ